MHRQRGFALLQQVWLVAGLLVIIAVGWHILNYYRTERGLKFSTPYQAVLLTNGAVYFGQLHGYGSSNPTLADVYYIVSQTNPDTKQVTSVLVKRGKEPHAPELMYLNPNAVLFVETVGPNSKVAQLIAQAHQ
ncbi:MAG: hypothetical protein ABSA32_15445 [Candidatus Acidiferrales bacterium]|jgi:hypothetical protein